MIYPQKLNSKNGEKIVRILFAFSIIVAIILILINKLTTPNIPWAGLSICGIIYVWITVMYSIKKNANIASHVLLQTLIISGVTLYIDKAIGTNWWSMQIAIPIILIAANITMLILTIISYKKYIKYAIYQLFIVLLSLIPLFLIIQKIIEPQILVIISIAIAIFSLNLSMILCYKDIKEAIIRKMHM